MQLVKRSIIVTLAAALMTALLSIVLGGYAHAQTPPTADAGYLAPSWPSTVMQAHSSSARFQASQLTVNANSASIAVPSLSLPAAAAGLHMRYVGTGATWAKCFPFGKRVGATPGELEFYADGNSQQRPGLLSLVAQHKATGGKPYTSGMVRSYPSVWRYGYFETSVLLDPRQGTWPAVWLRGVGSKPYWECDFEWVNACNKTFCSVHYSDPLTGITQHILLASVPTAAGWHRVGFWLQADDTTWFIDGKQVATVHVGAPVASYLIANLAVGGSWPGPPNALGFGTPTMDVGGFEVWQ